MSTYTNMNVAFDAACEIARSCEAGAWVAVHSTQQAWYGDGWTTPPVPAQGGSYSVWEFPSGETRAWKWAPGLKREIFISRDEYGIWETID